MDLFAVYAKTPKGLRKRNTMFVSLLSPLQSKVLALVDGSTSVKTILTKLDNVNGDDLDNALNSLLQNGFIRPTTIAPNTAVEWLPTSNFTPMVIEEFSDFDEVDAKEQETATQKAKQKEQAERAKAEAKIKAQLEAERKAKEAEEARLKAEAERKAREEAERQAKEEAKRLEAERKAKEAAELKARQEAEAKAKAEAEEKARIEAEARAKAEAERKAKEEAELKAKQEAERLAAEQKAKEEAEQQARLEGERIAREAEEARQREEAERKAREEAEKLEAERKAKAEAELKAKQEAERLAAEQKAKEEAEQQARLEAERITREAEEARQHEEAERKAREEAEKLEAERKAAEEKAKAEAAQQAKQDAETKAKAAAEEKARLEIERITREAKEARKHAEAEKKAKKEAEKKAKAEAEEQARLESERKAKEEAELKAKQETERLAAEQKAKEEAEAQARLEAERIAREAEEARLREEAELQAKVEAEEQARLQAEAEAEAAAEQAEREAEAAERLNAEQKTKQAKKLQALIIAERRQEAAHQKKLEEERALKRALEEEEIVLEGEYAETGAEDVEDDGSVASYEDKDRMLHDMVDEDDGFVPTGMEAEETSVAPKAAAITAPAEPESEYETDEQKLEALKRAAAAETHERKSSLSMMEKKRAITRKIRQWLQLPASLLKHTLRTSLLVGILLFAAIVGLLPYVPLKPLIEPVQKLAETQLNTTVNVRKASASLLPMPHLVLRDVEIGDNGQKIGLVKLWPEISKLQESQKVVKTLEISDANVSQENFGQVMGWLAALGDSPQLKVESIRLHKVVLTARDLEIGEFNGEISQTADHKIQMIQLNSTDDKLQVKIMPKGGNADITLEASQWALPLRQEIKFNKLTASGSASADRLEFSRIQGELYEGELDASAVLSWGGQWQTTGEFSLKHASAADVMQAFGSPIGVSGMVDWKGRFNGQSQEAQQLSANMNLSSDFAMEHGQLDDLDIGGAVVAKGNQSLAGDSTRFDSLRGTLQYSNQRYSLRNLALQSKQLRARADMSIAADGEISGNLSANLSTAGRSFNTNAALSGRGSDIKLR